MCRHGGDGVNHIHARDDFAKDRIAWAGGACIIQECVIHQVDEELTCGRISHIGSGHRDGAAFIEQTGLRFERNGWVQTRFLNQTRAETTALDHEAGDHSVKK